LQFTLEDQKRMRWHSRRGMLELDLILVPFSEHKLAGLTDELLGLYHQLLAEEDQDLFGWFIRREQAPSAGLREIIEVILASRAEAAIGQG
jgi:antitoxin CptB